MRLALWVQPLPTTKPLWGNIIPRTVHQLLDLQPVEDQWVPVGAAWYQPSGGRSWPCDLGDLCVPYPQERINCLEGSHEFFEAIGFKKVTLPVPDQGERAARQAGGRRGGMWDMKIAVMPLQRAKRSSTSWVRMHGRSHRIWSGTSSSCWARSLCGPLWTGSSESSAPQPWLHILSSLQISLASQLRR